MPSSTAALSLIGVGAHVEVLLDRQAGEHPAPLGHLDDAQRHHVVGRHVGEVLAVETDRALARRAAGR